MESYKFAQFLAALEKLDPWLKALGIDPKNDRIHGAIDLLRQADAISRKKREPPSPQEAGKFYFGLIEAMEIHDIFVAFEKADPRVLKEKLARAFSGPHRPVDETPSNADGRNIMFELSLGADFQFRGLPVELGDPDILVKLGPGYFFERKRPYRKDGLRSNIRDAAEQLEGNLERNGSAHGVVAISISRLLNPGDKLFVTEEENRVFGSSGICLNNWSALTNTSGRKCGCILAFAPCFSMSPPLRSSQAKI